MSYVPDYAPDADSQWRALDIRFQEMVLDVLDRLCLSPPKQSEHVADAVLEEGSIRHIIFVHVTIDHRRQIVTLVGVGHCARQS
jgi:hypothetical protein